jgi:TP901 family phage tail tape measure protein
VALSTRELLLVLRVSDRTGGALRRVSRDIGGLSSRQNLQMARQAQQINVQRANTARRIAAQNLISSRSGTAALRVEGQRLAFDKNRTIDAFKRAGIEQSARRNYEAQLNNAVKLSRLERHIAAGKAVKGFNVAETRAMHQAALNSAATLRREEELLAQKAGVAAGSLSGLALQEQKLTAATVELSAREAVLKERFRTTSDAARLQAARLVEIQSAQAQLRWDKLERGAQLMEHVGRVAAIGGVIGTLGLGGAARTAADFQTQLALAASQARRVGAPATQTLEKSARLQKVVLQQMRQFPATSKEMADSLYEIFSGTNIQRIDQAAGALTLFNKMAVAGGTDLGTMTQAGISLINNFDKGQYSIQNMTKEANLFFASVRYGRMNAQQFADSFNNIIPIAKEAGLQFKDVADAMAFITRQSGARATSRDATGLARLIDLFSRKEVQQGLNKYGVAVTDVTGKMRPLLDIITDIQKRINLRPGTETNQFFKRISALGGAGQGSKGLAGTQQARRVFAYLINDLDQYRKVSELVNRDTNEFQKSYAALAQTPGVKWQVFINQLKALAITIGTAVIPVFGQLGGYVERAINWFNGLSPATQNTIAKMALFVSIGALVGGTVLMIVGGITSLVLTMRLALRSFGFLGAEAGFISARFALFLGTAGALLFLLIKYPGILHRMITLVGGLKEAIALLGIAMIGLKFGPMILGMIGIGTAAKRGAGGVKILDLAIRRFLPIAAAIAAYEVFRGATTKHPKGAIQRGIHHFIYDDTAATEHFVRVHGQLYEKGSVAELEARRGIGERGQARVFEHGLGGANAATVARARRAQLALVQTNKKAAALAISTGLPTANVFKLEKTILQAKEALRTLDPVKDFKKYMAEEEKLYRAQATLQQNIDRAKYDAYIKSVNAKTSAEKKAQGHLATITRTQYFSELKNVVKLRNAYLRSHSAADAEKYFTARNRLAKESSDSEKQYTSDAIRRTDAAYKKSISDRKAAARKELQDQKRRAQEQNRIYADALSNLMNMYQQFNQEQQSNFGNIFQGPVLTGQRAQTLAQWGQHAGPADILKDLRAQVFQYGRFNRLVGSLGRRGAPRELVNQLRAAGPQAMSEIYAITKMTPAQWKAYVAAFKRGQSEIKKETMAQLNSQIAMYKQHGRNIARAIVSGITSQDVKVQKAIDNMLRRALGLKPTKDFKPAPSKGNIAGSTTIHITGHPGDHRTGAAIRHQMWRTRVHTSGAFTP